MVLVRTANPAAVSPEESRIETSLAQERLVHAALKARRTRKTVARAFGLTEAEVGAIKGRMDAADRAIARASRPAKSAGDWPPARLRNKLVLYFGVPEASVADPAVLAEYLSRSEMMATPDMAADSVRAVSGFLAAHGYALRD